MSNRASAHQRERALELAIATKSNYGPDEILRLADRYARFLSGHPDPALPPTTTTEWDAS
jgi:hypothetical protein